MYRVRTALTGMAGSPYLSTMYFEENALSANPQQEAVDAVGAFWGSIDNSLPNILTWATEAEVAVVDHVTGDVTTVFQTTPATGVGAVNATLHSPATQGLVRWQTNSFVGGRRIKGRTFIPGMSTSVSNANGTPTAAFQTLVNAAAQALIADALAPLVVWSRTHGARFPTQTGSMWGQFAVLRSRRD